MDFTTVIGVDRKTIEQLRMVWPTWVKHKKSTIDHPMLIFYDQVSPSEILEVVRSAAPHARLVAWPTSMFGNVQYPLGDGTKWTNPQRAKMLAGFCHVASLVETDYWFKIDTDAVATGLENWVRSFWFYGNPAIVAPKWSYTKPADQMVKLDAWAESNDFEQFRNTKPLNLVPEPGSNTVKHRRIASWCAFFNTQFTQMCSTMACKSCGPGKLPAYSQDGFHFYVAKRLQERIVNIQPKSLGWRVCNGISAIEVAAACSMNS